MTSEAKATCPDCKGNGYIEDGYSGTISPNKHPCDCQITPTPQERECEHSESGKHKWIVGNSHGEVWCSRCMRCAPGVMSLLDTIAALTVDLTNVREVAKTASNQYQPTVDALNVAVRERDEARSEHREASAAFAESLADASHQRDGLLDERDAAVRERDEATRKQVVMSAELTEAMTERDQALAQLRVVHAARDDVWMWQGDGGDRPASLSCPVVMSAETLRTILSERDDARARLVQQRDEATAAGSDMRRERDEARAAIDPDACARRIRATATLAARLATAEAVVTAAREGHDRLWGVHDPNECCLCVALSAHDAVPTAPTPVAAIFGTLGGDHTDAELLAMVDDVRGKGDDRCKCGLHAISADYPGVNWYWAHHTRTLCTVELPNDRCWCGRLRTEHQNAEGHDPTARKDPTT